MARTLRLEKRLLELTTIVVDWYSPRSAARLTSVFLAVALSAPFSVTAFGEKPNAEVSAHEALKPSDILDLARAASIKTEKQLRSARATASFEVSMQEPEEKQPSLRTKGRLTALYSEEKYLIEVDFDTRIRRTRYVDAAGGTTEKMAEWKPDRLVILADGTAVHVVEFSKRIHPAGCRVETYPKLRDACVSAGFPFRDPVRLWKEMVNVPRTMENLGPGGVKVEARGKAILGQYRIKNSPEVRVEFLLKPELGYRVTEYKVFNPGNVLATTVEADWKDLAGVWYVSHLEEVLDFKRVEGNGQWTRSVCEFKSFIPNVNVDASQFRLDVINTPPGTTFIDRRRSDGGKQKQTSKSSEE